jgi:hypothetical protein
MRWVVVITLVACGGGTVSTSDGGVDGSADATSSDSGVDLNKLGTPCQSGVCPAGLEPVTYCGFAGCQDGGGEMCSCEIKCAQDPKVCPVGSACAFVSDGPGQVCVKN